MLKNNTGSQVVFMQNGISSKIHEMTLSIVNLTGVINVGIGLKDRLKLKGYKFDSK